MLFACLNIIFIQVNTMAEEAAVPVELQQPEVAHDPVAEEQPAEAAPEQAHAEVTPVEDVAAAEGSSKRSREEDAEADGEEPDAKRALVDEQPNVSTHYCHICGSFQDLGCIVELLFFLMLLLNRRHLQRVLQQVQVETLSSIQGTVLWQHLMQQLVWKQRSPTAVTILATATLEWRARTLQPTA
jgi:hypothetical protein